MPNYTGQNMGTTNTKAQCQHRTCVRLFILKECSDPTWHAVVRGGVRWQMMAQGSRYARVTKNIYATRHHLYTMQTPAVKLTKKVLERKSNLWYCE